MGIDTAGGLLVTAEGVIWLLVTVVGVIWLLAWPHCPRLRVHIGKYLVGRVYIFRDKTRPGIVKIGMTNGRHTMKRKGEVSRHMADGGELAQIYAIDHIPFPRAVESVAHQIMSRRRVHWPAESTRGREWFHARGEAGELRAIKAVERAARLVRISAKKKQRWPAWADAKVAVWRLSGRTVTRYKLFG